MTKISWPPKEKWYQPELYDCEIFGHQYELKEYITGFTEHLQWTCIECEEIYIDDPMH